MKKMTTPFWTIPTFALGFLVTTLSVGHAQPGAWTAEPAQPPGMQSAPGAVATENPQPAAARDGEEVRQPAAASVRGEAVIPALSASGAAVPPRPAPAGGDANAEEQTGIEQLMVSPTAMTQPKGTLSLHAYEVLFVGITYGLTDRLEVSLDTVLSTLGEDEGSFLMARGKAQMYRGDRLRVAVHGLAASVDDMRMLGAGATATFCITPSCRWLVNGNLLHLWLGNQGNIEEGTLVTGAMLVGLTPNIMLMAESARFKESESNRWDSEGVTWYGVRLAGRRGSIDIGAMQVSDSGDETIPWLNVVVRAN